MKYLVHRKLTAWVVSSAIAISGCSTISVGSHHDDTINFGAYKSFSWVADDPYISGDRSTMVSPLAREYIRNAIQRELQAKGYSFSADRQSADFAVAYTVGTREMIRVDSYPADYRGPWGWHVPYSYYYYHDVSAHSYTQGTLGVDVFDNASRKPVWHGWAEKAISRSDREDPKPAIDEAVARLFEHFPD